MLLPTLLLSGCLINEAAYLQRLAELTDGDGDGYAAEDDCDDGLSTVFPGAAEVCNERDDNCDGAIEIGAPLADSTAPDAGRVYVFFAP